MKTLIEIHLLSELKKVQEENVKFLFLFDLFMYNLFIFYI